MLEWNLLYFGLTLRNEISLLQEIWRPWFSFRGLRIIYICISLAAIQCDLCRLCSHLWQPFFSCFFELYLSVSQMEPLSWKTTMYGFEHEVEAAMVIKNAFEQHVYHVRFNVYLQHSALTSIRFMIMPKQNKHLFNNMPALGRTNDFLFFRIC